MERSSQGSSTAVHGYQSISQPAPLPAASQPQPARAPWAHRSATATPRSEALHQFGLILPSFSRGTPDLMQPLCSCSALPTHDSVPSLMPPPPPPAHPAATRTARTATHTPAQGAGTQHPWRSVIWAPLPWWQTYPWSQRAASAPASPKSSPAHPAQPTALSLQLGCGAATHRHAAFPAPCRAQRHGHLLPPPPRSSSGATPALLVPRGTHST